MGLFTRKSILDQFKELTNAYFRFQGCLSSILFFVDSPGWVPLNQFLVGGSKPLFDSILCA